MDCMKELMKYSYMLIYKVGEYAGKVRDEELKIYYSTIYHICYKHIMNK